MTLRPAFVFATASVLLMLAGCATAGTPAAAPSAGPSASATAGSSAAPGSTDPLPTLPLACADLFSDATATGLIFRPVSLKVDEVTVHTVYEAAGLQTGLFHCTWGGVNKTDNSWDQTIDLDILPNAAAAFDAGVWQVNDGAVVYPAGSVTSEYLCTDVESYYAQCFANVLVNGYWAHARISTGDTGAQLSRDGMEASMRTIVDRLTAALSSAGAARAAWTPSHYSLTGAICGGTSIVGNFYSGAVPAEAVAAQRSGAVSCNYSGSIVVIILPGGGWVPASVAANGQRPTSLVAKYVPVSIPGADLALWGCGDGCWSLMSIGGSAVEIGDRAIYDGDPFLAELPGIVNAIVTAG